MADVQIDIVEGTAASHALMGGWTITRIAIVTGLNADGLSDTALVIQDAEDAVVGFTGVRGSACPNVGVGTFLDHFETELIGATAAKVRIIYKGYPRPTYEFDGGLCQFESNLDLNGAPILLSYTYPAVYPLDPRKAGLTVQQGGMYSRSVPQSIFTVRWIIAPGVTIPAVTATQLMTTLKQTYEGKVNNASFTIGTIVGAARTWLIEKVAGMSRDGGRTYEAAMTFHYKANTWDERLTFINPDDGKPPPDLVSGTGYKTVQVFPSVAFPTFVSGYPQITTPVINYIGN